MYRSQEAPVGVAVAGQVPTDTTEVMGRMKRGALSSLGVASGNLVRLCAQPWPIGL